MNPNSSGEVRPQVEAAPNQSQEAGAGQAVERRPSASPENNPQMVQQASQAANAMALPGQDITVGAPDDTAPDDNTAQSASPAADADRIEKQWIDRTKVVIAQTQDDPYEQKKAMSHVKADYIKKRFNKTIKTDDPVTK
jgi:hypothetical protein